MFLMFSNFLVSGAWEKQQALFETPACPAGRAGFQLRWGSRGNVLWQTSGWGGGVYSWVGIAEGRLQGLAEGTAVGGWVRGYNAQNNTGMSTRKEACPEGLCSGWWPGLTGMRSRKIIGLVVPNRPLASRSLSCWGGLCKSLQTVPGPAVIYLPHVSWH